MKINFFALFCDKIKPIPNSKVGGSMKAEIIAVGTEILTGQIVNTNAQFLSEKLASLGIIFRQQWGTMKTVFSLS